MAYWSIRAGEDDEARDVFLSGVIAMDWEPPDLAELPNDGEAFKEAYHKARPPKDAEMATPEKYKNKVAQNAGTMRRFVYDMKVGDYVVYPSDHLTPKNGWIYLGRVVGLYQFDPQQPLQFWHQRAVSWLVPIHGRLSLRALSAASAPVRRLFLWIHMPARYRPS